MLRFFLLLTFRGKIGQKFAREVLKRASQKCGRRLPPIVLLVEIHKPEIFKIIFSRSFLQIIEEIGREIRSETFIQHTGSTISVEKSKNEKCGSRPPPPLCYPLVENVIFLIFIHTMIKMH